MSALRGSAAWALAALLCAGAAAAADAAPPPDGAGGFSRNGAWIVDAQGRVAVMHGFNIVRKVAPYYPPDFGEQDAAFLAGQGFDLARIALIWAAVEPAPGIYDDAYIRRIAALNELLARHGIHTLVDFHQDTWGEGIHKPQGDGAPAWATFGAKADQAFQAFWHDRQAADGIGVQSHFIAAWSHAAQILDASPASANIVGLDPFNEPFPGADYPRPCGDFSPCPAFERGPLADFYRRLIAALRQAGDSHLILVEGIAQNATGMPALPAFDDPQTAFNWHYYCPLAPLDADPARHEFVETCRKNDLRALDRIDRYVRQLGLPWLLSEFGATDDLAEQERIVDQLEQRFVSWTNWMYYTRTSEPGNPAHQGLLIDDSQPGSEANAKAAKLDALEVPYAQAIAGAPLSTSYDRATRVYRLAYAPRQAAAPTEVFVPQRVYPEGYQVQVQGAAVTRRPSGLTLSADPSAKTVTLEIAPAALRETGGPAKR
jgi:endoglycosylceramidase